MSTFTNVTKNRLSWELVEQTNVTTPEVDFLFSDGTDFLFSDGTDYVFSESGRERNPTVWSPLVKNR